ncbi:phosphoenolpyruvate carboxykinase (GTP) [uncultured Agrococcus sp.]|uniref:phosphoenolpyruvate carboxykinase (GTP) n=1 Tax=uncultured Agrococcus sp. TaxID=382258 RepID=UPI0025E2801A|nr:phosphoenolpyruvate carboxykinase (GTP) [uncultured Agrococcus sp.]
MTHDVAQDVRDWVDEIAAKTQPKEIRYLAGTDEEYRELTQDLLEAGTIVPVPKRPGSYLARSSRDDVARMEDRTFICSEHEIDAGPTNNWHDPTEMRSTLDELFTGSMRGRTLFVVPFTMGPLGGPISQIGVEITDSAYVAVSMMLMTRVTPEVHGAIDEGAFWVKALHSVGAPLDQGQEDIAWPSNPTRYITHFPETREIISYGSAYGGNALLAKKAFALRIASVMARDEGWMAEHMLILRMRHETGRVVHIAGAFPSACGKTNLAMLQSSLPEWQVETIGDDIAWLRPGSDGRLWAINPEYGFFGVAPGTSEKTNKVAMDMMERDVMFTNVALTDDGDVWWEGMSKEIPANLTDWQGNAYDPTGDQPAAHPNARFTVRASQAPSIAPDYDAPEGFPIDAIIFGGRRPSLVPLVLQSRSWQHGVFVGSTISSQQTAAAEGPVGQIRRDPFAMLPFAGYNMGDYFGHWLRMGEQLGDRAPKIFNVNWFRRDEDGGFLWPGFSENARVLDWIAKRLVGEVPGVETPVGILPAADELNLTGLDIDAETLNAIITCDVDGWQDEMNDVGAFFERFGHRLPNELSRELADVQSRLSSAYAAS